jgi:hypothetical protein
VSRTEWLHRGFAGNDHDVVEVVAQLQKSFSSLAVGRNLKLKLRRFIHPQSVRSVAI